MQIRLDADIAKIVKRDCEAHRRIFKRQKPYAAVVNDILRDVFGRREKGSKPPWYQFLPTVPRT